MSAELTDGELLESLHAGDVTALEVLYDRHAGYVLAIALRILRVRADAEEVLQDVFWQLWKGRVRYDPARGRFTTWLYSVARSRALDRIRGRTRRPDSSGWERVPDRPREDAVPSADPEVDVLRAERARVVQSALLSLPGQQREAIELAYYGGMSHSEIATRVGEPIGTVKSRIRRGIEKLRVSLAGPGGDG